MTLTLKSRLRRFVKNPSYWEKAVYLFPWYVFWLSIILSLAIYTLPDNVLFEYRVATILLGAVILALLGSKQIERKFQRGPNREVVQV